MVFQPPHLRLNVSEANRNGVFTTGNDTNVLVFEYYVLTGDSSRRLDYVDTREAPYDMVGYTSNSLALNTDVTIGTGGRLYGDRPTPRYNDIFLIATKSGGVFSATESPTQRVQANTFLPLPGAPGSLSSSSNIIIDTSAPFITSVYPLAPTGDYGENVNLLIAVRFNFPVVVNGCPYLVFQVQGLDRKALFAFGNGTTDLVFDLYVLATDQKFSLDYANIKALKNGFCDSNTLPVDPSSIFIKRASMHPVIRANLTLPPIGIRTTIISPTSITGGGYNITLTGGAAKPTEVYSCYGIANATYSAGDILDVRVHFSEAVKVADSSFFILSLLSNTAYFEGMANVTDAVFKLVVLPEDSSGALTYPNIYSLRTIQSCDIVDVTMNRCASQNLPLPYSNSPDSNDAFSRLYLKIVPFSLSELNGLVPISSPYAKGVEFVFPQGRGFYQSGDLINFTIYFSDSVAVVGEPFLQLQFNSGSIDLFLYRSPSSSALTFALLIDNPDLEGLIACSVLSKINLNGGRITRAHNFIPIQNAFLQIQPLCCPNLDCGVSAVVIANQPKVQRVYAMQSGVYSAPSILDIFVVYSRPVEVTGRLVLDLYLPTGGTAVYENALNPTVLHFTYMIQMMDFTSQLDYVSSYALHFTDGNADNGVHLKDAAYPIQSDLTLPQPGTANSLGRQSAVVIVMGIPRLENLTVSPLVAVMGDPLLFSLVYSSDITFIDSFKMAASLALIQANVFLSFVISPAADSNGTFTSLAESVVKREATFLYELNDTLVFSYEITTSDPTGYVEIQSNLPVTFGALNLVSKVFTTITSSIVPNAYVNTRLASIDNVRPYVLSVTSNRLSTVYPLGVGDSVIILIHFSAPVIAFKSTYNQPNLLLLFSNGITNNASFMNSSIPSTVLTFNYTIKYGDDANPLMYDGVHALSGDIRRYTPGRSLLPANLTLPTEKSFSSLGGTSNLFIDTAAPYVRSMFAVNKPGVYGFNDTIIIICRFSRPVTVLGDPQLTLQVGNGITGTATYIRSYPLNDVRIQILDTDVLFMYSVGVEDDIPTLHHAGPSALYMPNGSYIFLRSTYLYQEADLSLRNYSDMGLSYGKIERQWMINYPFRVEVLLRDLYHSAPASLTVTLEHNGVILNLFAGACTGKTFGSTFPRSRLGNNSTALSSDVDIGYDYFFSDTQALNYASLGAATQSSTSGNYTASLAIDGNRDPYLSDLSVSATLSEFQPWWVVYLPENTSVKTISIWPRSPETWIPPVIRYTVKQLDGFPRGYYRLRFSNIDLNNASFFVDTPVISLGASEEELSAALNQISSLGDVLIKPKLLQMCKNGVIVFRCTDDSEYGYGYIYQLTLLNVLVKFRIIDSNIYIRFRLRNLNCKSST